MCPPAPVPPPADIGLYWTDEELCMCLEKLERGSPLPGNVIADINPYQYMPSHLPEGIWYIIPSDGNKTTELGFWKARGEANKIFTNSVTTVWRTTLEFYEGQTPQGRRTNWVMQEYKITPKELCHNIQKKDSKSLCRVFHTGRQSPNVEVHPKHGSTAFDGRNHPHSTPLTIPKADGRTGQGSRSECQVKKSDEETGLLTVAERLTDPPAENLHEFDYILRGDYLELHDLADTKSPSSSSDNSSCLSLTSEECFDALDLLQDLEDGNNEDLQRKDSSLKMNVSASVRPNEVVMPPPTLGSLISGCGSKLPVERTLSVSASKEKFIERRVPEHAVKRLKENHINGGTSNFSKVAESSSSAKPGSEGQTEPVVGRMKKLKRKYLCFMPF